MNAMRLTTTTTLNWAEDILRQLGDPVGQALEVTVPPAAPEPEVPYAETAFTSRLEIHDGDGPTEPSAAARHIGSVRVVLAFDDGSSTHVLLEDSMTEAEAVALLAEQLQDAVLEHTGGAPVPPCPGHSHPAVAEVVDGVACWTCPQGGRDGRTRPVLSGAVGHTA
ncbi:hypothetical protein KQY30_03685 [Streptomyces sp. GMY02]|uniref:hypothetical protein n=1 Tax=Streptomyces sp. GMY02 TaxID=1333528 RepID=UPI001C2BF347|nr:hypothetical protein [Streptomyces sp. GMY02]QXE33523.1 hypothetical protein KQY30_03685 [Streptomyces sp. GMY02]